MFYKTKITNKDIMEMPVMVNGKLRARMQIKQADSTNEKLLKEMALKEENVINFLAGKDPKKIIVIKGKIVNIVI